MNPIIKELLALLSQGKTVHSLCAEPKMAPNKKVVFRCEDGTTELGTQGDHNTFSKWWGETAHLIRRMRKIDELDQNLD